MLILDANAALVLSLHEDGFKELQAAEPAAPPLLWSETRSVLHVNVYRGLISSQEAKRSLELIGSGAIKEHRHPRLGHEAWRIAGELGWAKTYDAEYLALAALTGARLVTFDRRLVRAAERLGLVAGFEPPR